MNEDKDQKRLQTAFMECIKTFQFGDDIDPAINNFLAVVGNYYDAERAYIFEFNPDGMSNSNIYEWVKDGSNPEIDHLKMVSNNAVAKWIELFEKQDPILITKDGDNGAKDKEEYKFLDDQNINSLLIYPLHNGERLIGYMGVDDPKQSLDDTTLLQWVGAFVGNDLEKRRKEDEKLLLALANLYLAIYSINLKTMTFHGLIKKNTLNSSLKEGFASGNVRELKARMMEIVTPEFREEMDAFGHLETIAERLKNSETLIFECMINGGSWVRVNWVTVDTDHEGNPFNVLFMIQNITKEKEVENRLRYRSEHDSLTGALNRRGYAKEIEAIQASGKPVGFMMVDIDRFKEINDEFGHEVGDDILIALTRSLRRLNGHHNIVIRIGGDEFVVLFPGLNPNDKESLIEDFNTLNASMQKPKKGLPPCTVSAGVAYSPIGEVEKLYQIADDALYESKDSRPSITFKY